MNDMTTVLTRPVRTAALERVEELLRRYPDIAAEESGEILHFLKKGTALEIGLLSGNDDLRPALDAFRAAHARDLSLGMRELLIVAAIVVLTVVACALLWDWGVTR
jgi:hypothetical protein